MSEPLLAVRVAHPDAQLDGVVRLLQQGPALDGNTLQRARHEALELLVQHQDAVCARLLHLMICVGPHIPYEFNLKQIPKGWTDPWLSALLAIWPVQGHGPALQIKCGAS